MSLPNVWNNKLFRPGLDNTRLFISLTAGAGTRCMSLRSSPPSLYQGFINNCYRLQRRVHPWNPHDGKKKAYRSIVSVSTLQELGSQTSNHVSFVSCLGSYLWEPINDLCHELYFSSWKCCLGTSYVYCRFRIWYKSLFLWSYNLNIITNWNKNI